MKIDHKDPREKALADYEAKMVVWLDALNKSNNATADLRKAADDLMDAMHEVRRKSVTYRDGNIEHRAVLQTRTTTEVNEDGLKKALGARLFNRFTYRKLDKKRLEKGIDTGEVDPVVVSKFVEAKMSEPYLTYRPKEIENDGEGSDLV